MAFLTIVALVICKKQSMSFADVTFVGVQVKVDLLDLLQTRLCSLNVYNDFAPTYVQLGDDHFDVEQDQGRITKVRAATLHKLIEFLTGQQYDCTEEYRRTFVLAYPQVTDADTFMQLLK